MIKFRYSCILLFSLFFLLSLELAAQVKVLSVDPTQTAPDIERVHGPHIAVSDPAVRTHNKLILMLVGTGGHATYMRGIDSIFATMGFPTISIDYKNKVISTICAHSKDSTCSGRFRREIITGDPVSEKTEVDSANSILNRFREFLLYLAKNDPQGGWKKFLKNGEPQWRKIIVAGHSQGAGHAAYLGKLFKVSRVLIFSGPQDYLEDLHKPSAWLSMKSATPANRYYAFLNLKDPFHVKYQIANCEKLMQHALPDTLMVRPGIPIQSKHHILVNNIPTKDAHGSTLFPEFQNVWAYMLGIKYHEDEKKK